MEWTQWLPLIAGGVALLGMWGAIQHRLGKLEARMNGLEQAHEETRAENIRMHQETRAENIRMYQEARAENIRMYQEVREENIRMHQEARAENIRMHQEARAENIRLHEETRREIRLVLQGLREHTHADGSPATTPIPVDGD